MKILAIRGQNLASLQDEFRVDLSEGALGRAGLFAITGPTGAGKSTLLDAVCLCLYDSTPRLSQRGGAAVVLPGQDSEGALPANDQRNILRRGAAHGWAEVDFVGRDGRTYTARWEVHRARKRAEGKVQPQSVTLRDANDQPIGGTKGETLDEIRKRVGLDFDQFRRSVLLAQGDFAAFLRADQNERADLLEQMTGTEIYTRLSQAAFFRKKQLDGQLRELETRLDAQGVLSEPDRAAARAALDAATVERQGAVAVVAGAQAAVQWHQQQAAFQQGVAQAQAQLQAALQALALAQERRDDFTRAERGWPLRGLARQVAQAQEQARKAHQDRVATARALADAQARATAAEQAVVAAQADLARTRLALVDQVEGRLAHCRDSLAELDQWLAAHPQHKRMADPERVGLISRRLDERGRLRTRLADSLASLPGLEQAVAQATHQRAAAQQAAALAEQAEATAAQAVHAAVQGSSAHDDAALLRRRRDLDLRDRALGELERLAERADALVAQLARAQADRDAAQAGHDAAQAQAAAATAAGQDLLPRLEEARHALALARAAVDATDLRATLVDGQPCPVCGSPEHPWAAGSPLAGLHDQHHQRVQELEAQQAGHQAQAAAHQATAQAHAHSRDQAATALARTKQQLAELAIPWQAQAAAFGQPDLPGPRDHALADLRTRLDQARADLGTEEAAASAARRAVEAARVKQQLVQDEARKAQQAVTAADKAVARAESALSQASTQLATDQASDAQLQDELASLLDDAAAELPAVAGWRDDASPVLEACQQAGQDWERRSRRRDQAAAVIAELEPRLAGHRERAEQARTGVATEDLAQAPPPAPPAHLHPPQVTDWLDDHAAQLARTVDQRRQAARQAQQALATATQAAAAADAAADTLARQEGAARQQLAEQLVASALDQAALDALVARPDGWLDAERAALRALEDAPAAARTLLAERQARQAEHAQDAPDGDAAQAEAELETALAAQAAADEAWSAARATLQADDAARAKVGQLRQQIEAHQAAARPWLQLADCIGSGSGVEFKRFAQSLTLEALLDQANSHLRQLQPRYSLARIHGTDLDILVVDHDLGDEPRTVQSLSGGEAFLTSLALALGLSSLSSRDVRVESLFIDEGFGTLDARTLDTALAVLDSLQAAGRQVGVISHVGGLAERIGVQVKVRPLGGGRSAVSVVEG